MGNVQSTTSLSQGVKADHSIRLERGWVWGSLQRADYASGDKVECLSGIIIHIKLIIAC